MKTTLNAIRKHRPCSGGWTKLLAYLGKKKADDEPLAITTILDSNGLDDALWCLRAVTGHDREIRLYAVWCARQVQHLMTDPRSIAAGEFEKGDAMSDEWVMVPREPTAEMVIRGAESLHDNGIRFETDGSEPQHDLAADTYRKMLDAAPQQAEPVAQIGWADEFGNLFPMGAWQPAQRTHHDSHKTAWRAVYLHPPAEPQQAEPVAWAVFDPSGEAIYAALFKTRCVEYVDNEYRYGHGAAKHWAVRPVFAHPPAAEVQRLRDAARDVCEWADAAQWALGNETGVPAAKLDALRKALEGGE